MHIFVQISIFEPDMFEREGAKSGLVHFVQVSQGKGEYLIKILECFDVLYAFFKKCFLIGSNRP